LGVSTYRFAWLFVPLITGIMTGAVLSGRLAGRLSPQRTIGPGYACVFAGSFFNLLVAALVPPSVPWHVLPLFVFTMGTSVVMLSLTLLLPDLFPAMQGWCLLSRASFNLLFLGSMQARSRRSLRIRSCCSQAIWQL